MTTEVVLLIYDSDILYARERLITRAASGVEHLMDAALATVGQGSKAERAEARG